MNIRNLINRHTFLMMFLCVSTTHVQQVQAAQLAIEDSPLFLLNSAKPNIFFVFDDSGSMDAELITNSTEVNGNWGYVISLTEGSDTFSEYRYVFDDAMSDNNNNDDRFVVPHPDLIAYVNAKAVAEGNSEPYASGNVLTKSWKAFAPAYNKLYYNPEIDYKPWPGYSNADPASARRYPSTSTNTVSLIDYRQITGSHPSTIDDNNNSVVVTHQMEDYYPAQYYYWADDGDGVVEDGEGVQVFISDGGSSRSTETISVGTTSAGSFVIGDDYQIVTAGTTDFTLIGAADNNPGTIFTATGAGSGTGTASSIHIGSLYEIATSGNTNFTLIGAADNNPGTVFTATGVGSGTGTVYPYPRDKLRPTASVQCATGVNPTTVAPCTKRAYADEIQNFANWFVYYRKRLLTAKGATGLTINDPFSKNTRMGMAVISDSSNGEVQLAPMFDSGLSPNDTNKTTLLNTLFSTNVDASGQTPLKEALDKAGSYYKCETSFFADDTCALEGMSNKTTYTTGSAAECQQNYTIMITDGGYTDDNGTYYGNEDADTSSPADGYQFDGAPYADSEPSTGNRSTLADIAMHYYKRDMFNFIPNKVPTSCFVDENPAQHMVTYMVTFGVTGTLAWDDMPARPIATSNCGTPGTATAPSWPTGLTTFSLVEKLDDTLHAAYNGRGTYLSANSASELIDGLKTSLLDIAGRKGVSSAIGLSSTNNTGNTSAYLATFNSGGWYGELEAYAINTNGTLAANPTWSASTWLDDTIDYNDVIDTEQITATNLASINTGHCLRLPATASCTDADAATNPHAEDSPTGVRNIITSTPDDNSAADHTAYGFGRPFRWSKIDDSLKNDLRTDSTGTTSTAGDTTGDAIAKERLNYIRGDHRCELDADLFKDGGCTVNTGFRPRNASGSKTRLGDLVNSTPVYVKEAIGNYSNAAPFPAASYHDFKAGNESSAFTSGKTAETRTPMLYIGGNDGMLHAFNASTTLSKGKEEFAFIPRTLAGSTSGSGLHKLTEQNAHRSYVDLTPTIADAYISTPNESTRKWRTVLVGGLRNGGKGIYALDVTDPDAIIDATTSDNKAKAASKKVLWEFTDGDLGNTFSQPVIVPLRVRSGNTAIGPGTTTHAIEWYVVFGNGYNSTSEEAVLYLLPLSGPGADNVWQPSEYTKIHTGATGSNGLSSPAVIDYDADGIFDRAYAGDLLGNMWAFKLTGNSPSSWSVALKQGTTNKPLAIAKDGSDNRQPILAKPVITRNAYVVTSNSNQPNAIVLFGTGRYMVDGDQSSTSEQTFYAIYDNGDTTKYEIARDTTQSDTSYNAGLALVAKTLLSTTETEVRTVDPSGTSVNYNVTDAKGWYFDLPDSGERVTEKATLVGSTLFFSSIVPSTTSPCSGGGYSWLNAFNPYTGDAPAIQVFNTNTDAVINSDDIKADFATAGTTTTGIKNAEMVPIFSYLSDQRSSPSPCAEGSSVQGIGSSTNANVGTQQLCAEGGSAKAGRYSWRQLSFD